MNALESQYKEDRKSPEHVYHQDTVRVALYRMDGTTIESQMIPSPGNIDTILAGTAATGIALEHELFHDHSSAMPQMTTVMMEIKANGKAVVNPEQLILPGGGGIKVDPEKPISEKTILKTARRELFDEVHLNAHKAHVAPNASYTYSFDHPRLPDIKSPGRLKNTTHLVIAKGAPHDKVNYFDPKDKLQNVVGLLPSQVTTLFANNGLTIDGKFYPIVDSLSRDTKNHKKARVQLYNSPDQFTQTVETESYVYESFIQRKVLSRLLQLSKIGKSELTSSIRHFIAAPKPTTKSEAQRDLSKTLGFIQKIEKRLNPLSPIGPALFPEQTIVSLTKRGVTKERIAKRSMLTMLMNEAVRQVKLDITTEYYKEAGPQFPLLLAHTISQVETWGAYEYSIISRCPELKHIIDTICDVFEINPRNDMWHAQLLEQFNLYRQLEFSDFKAYEQVGKTLAKRFCNPTSAEVWRIGDPEKLGYLSGEVNKFIEKEILALSHKIPKENLNRLNGDPLGTSTSEIGELMMIILGVDQYADEPVHASERAAALCKLVHELHMDRVDAAARVKTNLHIKPIRESAKAIIGAPVETITIEGGRYTRHHIPKELLAIPPDRSSRPYDGEFTDPVFRDIDVSQFDVDIFFSLREKDKYSRYRKFLAQGILEHPEREMTDEFGFMLALDIDSWKKALSEEYPHLSNDHLSEMADYFSVWAIQRILVKFHDQLDERRASLHPKHTLEKGRWDKKFSKILTIEPQDGGSAASDSDSFQWLKYGYMMHDDSGVYELEWQIFRSLDDLIHKKLDDPDYNFRRHIQFIEHRYSMLETLFGSKKAYNDVMSEYHKRKDPFYALPSSIRMRIFTWYHQLLLDLAKKIESTVLFRRDSSNN